MLNLRPPAPSILDLVGNTPMVELRRVVPPGSAHIFVKLEFLSPGGSVKDRIGVGMIRAAEEAGLISPGATLIEPTAGNTGVALALAGVQLGYRVMLVVPENFSVEKRELMKALGGEVVLTSADDGMKGAIDKAQELSRSIPGSWVPQQFRNRFNSDAHYRTTGPEIWEQLAGKVDGWVAGAGTGGTFTGTARYLKEQNPELHAVVVEPQGSVFQGGDAGPHEVEGIGSSFIPDVLDLDLASDVIMVPDPPAFAMVARLAREEGILSGSSGGANVVAALQLAAKLGEGRNVVTLIPDSAERYLSKQIFTRWAAEGEADPTE
ncbi:MAG: cysteine synthase A [Thermoanaerobaculia bacterium]